MKETRNRYPYRYETHLHTAEGSKCAKLGAEEQIDFYADRGYAGVFVTDHFWGNSSCRVDQTRPFPEQIEQYFSFTEKARKQGLKRGIDVFTGIEYTYQGTDFLIYGLDAPFLSLHPEIPDMTPRELVRFARENGALVIQAHPFRLTEYSKIIRIMPREVDGFEIKNGSNTDFENRQAEIFAREYKILKFAGSDNHGRYDRLHFLAGVDTTRRVKDERDFVEIIKSKKYRIFGE